MSSGPSYRQPPAMRDDLPYAEWKKELNIWSDFTDLDEKRQGGALFLTLTGKAREAVLAGVTRDKIKSDKGITEIVTCLDELYLKDENQCAFTAYDDFTSYRRSHNMSFPLATEFNETIAMDIKFINSRPVLHLIDHATRYSRACLLANKKPMSVVQAIITHWIQVFGQPTQFLTDNGGEFVNSELIELAEKFNIVLKTTAAESPWSNGLCEKHNGVIGDMVAKIQADSNCSLELAIPWAVSAKNGLSNVYGFSPNQLVFGRNVRLPDVHNDKPPAQNQSHTSSIIANHLVALHKARQAFIAQESCEKLRRALNKRTRSYSDVVYHNGDDVYYKRQNSFEWHGPARVLGRDGAQYLLKHGGSYVRVHPCKMQLVNNPVRETMREKPKVDTHTRPSMVDVGAQCVECDDSDSDDNETEDEQHDSGTTPDYTPPSPPPTPFHPPPPLEGESHHQPPPVEEQDRDNNVDRNNT